MCSINYECFPHITRKEFGENIDEILERVETEQTGFVITDENKNDFFLCPIEWYNRILLAKNKCIVISALRYALGRNTYMPDEIIRFIRNNIELFDRHMLSVMVSDIQTETDDPKLFRREEWIKLSEELSERIEQIPI